MILTFGTGKGVLTAMATMLMQNIILIPAFFAIGVSGAKLYKSIIKDKRRENIKLEIYKHTIFSAITLIPMVLSSFIEVYISTPMLMYTIKYL